MFGLFKNKNNMHRADNEIDSLVLIAVEEGNIFAGKLIGKSPEYYNECVKSTKISFEFSWLILESTCRHFNSPDLIKAGDYVHQRMTGRLLDIYAEFYSFFMEGKRKDIYQLLGNMVNERTLECAKLRLMSIEQGENTVFDSVAKNVLLILSDNPNYNFKEGIIEFLFIKTELAKSALDDKFWEALVKIKDKLTP